MNKKEKNDKRGCRHRKSTREGFGELLGVFERYLGESFPCRNPPKTFNKTKKNQTKTKENKQKLYFYLFFYSFLCLHPSEGVPGVDLDMPDSILTSPDLRNHQKHPKQKKNLPKQNLKKKCKTLILKRFLITAYFV